MKWGQKLTTDLMEIGLIRRLVKFHAFQFLFLVPATLLFIIATLSVIFGIRHPGFSFGLVFTWVVWWGL